MSANESLATSATGCTRPKQALLCRQAVQAFCSGVQCGLGTSGSVAVGPLGRQADAGLQVGSSGAAMLYSYSVSRGAFAGALLLHLLLARPIKESCMAPCMALL